MAEKLTGKALDTAVASLAKWSHDAAKGAVTRVFKFADFAEAFGFMARVALIAQKADHHPDWSNSYDTVTVTLSTHSAGGVTQKDIDLAKAIDKASE